MKVDEVLELLIKSRTVKRSKLNELCWGGRNITSLIQVLQKKWYEIKINYDASMMPISYQYIKYKMPFYLIARDIQRNYPEFENKIRKQYSKLIK